MNEQTYELRDVREVFTEVEEATSGIGDLPRLLQLLIDSYNLDSAELTDDERYDLSMASDTIYSVLYIVQNSLYTMNEKLKNISIKKYSEQDNKEALSITTYPVKGGIEDEKRHSQTN